MLRREDGNILRKAMDFEDEKKICKAKRKMEEEELSLKKAHSIC